jgi:antitoxin CptB
MDRGRLQWHCRRGMRELDVLLEAFLRQDYAGLAAQDQARFEQLLAASDPDLHAWLTGRRAHPDGKVQALVERIAAAYSGSRRPYREFDV